MEITLIVLIIALIVLVVSGFIYLRTQLQAKPKDDQSMLMIQNQINELARTMHDGLDHSHKAIQTQFVSTSRIITDVTERLTKLDETNRQVLTFSEQLQSLENILTNPKQRGILGEYFLETVLKNVLPPSSYQMQ